MDEVAKTCLKVSELKPCQRVTAFCGPAKLCITEAFMTKDKSKPEEMKKAVEDRLVS